MLPAHFRQRQYSRHFTKVDFIIEIEADDYRTT